MRKITVLLVTAFVIAAFAGFTYANCGVCQVDAASGASSASAAKGEVVNAQCPVMGGKVSKDTKFTAEYKGQTVGFCCADCVKAFKADPEKYAGKLNLK